MRLAQEQPADTARETKTPNEFVAVEGGGETTSAEALLVSAYIVMWALLLLFIFLTWRRQRTLEGRLGQLEKALTKVDGGG
jgi:CcmD family protein